MSTRLSRATLTLCLCVSVATAVPGPPPQGSGPAGAHGIVRPGYSWCAHGYMLTRRGIEKVVGTRRFDRDLMPVDEFLPALYVDHEREEIRQRYPKVLNAYAVTPSLVIDLPRSIWGTDTEDSAFVGR